MISQSSSPELSSHKTTEVMCQWCLTVFTARRDDARYCPGSRCRVAAFRDRRKAAERKLSQLEAVPCRDLSQSPRSAA